MTHKEYKKLYAEWYELMSAGIDHSEEINFWARCIKESGEPVLELGSGTGRVLVPLLEQGFDIVGIDTSEDMMARCFTIVVNQRNGTLAIGLVLHHALVLNLLDRNAPNQTAAISVGPWLQTVTDTAVFLSDFNSVGRCQDTAGYLLRRITLSLWRQFQTKETTLIRSAR